MLVSLQLGVFIPLLFDWQRKCHHTPLNKVGLKYLLSPHNLFAVYLIDAGDLKHLVYQLNFRQGLSNHFVNPRLGSEQ